MYLYVIAILTKVCFHCPNFYILSLAIDINCGEKCVFMKKDVHVYRIRAVSSPTITARKTN